MPRLEFRDQSYKIEGDEVVVGRHSTCGIIVQDTGISKCHFRLIRDGEDWFIEDMQSRSGTHLNGSQVPRAKLHHGDVVSAGTFTFIYFDESVAIPEEPAAPTKDNATKSFLAERICVICGDITKLDADAIVNAANQWLLGGGGVDGAIHRAAGPELLAECRTLGGCPTGQARITGGYRLPAKYVIHAVGPVYHTGQEGEAEQLRSCYEVSLRLAAQQELCTIVFPCISTGAFGYPKEAACRIAVDTVIMWLRANKYPRRVTFCCYEAADAELYRDRLRSIEDGI